MSNTNFDQLDLQTQRQHVTVNDHLQALVPGNFSGVDLIDTSALTLAIFGGDFWTGSAFSARADGTIALTASTVNYIEEDPATGTISKNVGSPTGFVSSRRPLYAITTGANGVTLGGIADYRRIAWQDAKVRFNSVDFVVGGTAPTTGFYSPSSDLIRTPNSVTIDDNLTVTGGLDVTSTCTFRGAVKAAAVGALWINEGARFGADSTNNLLDDATNGAGTATLWIGNASINVTSDEHVKYNIRPFEDGLSVIRALLPIEFDQDEERPWGHVRHYVGFGARHTNQIAPWAVHTQGDTGLPWKMRQEFLMAPTVRAVQQIDERLRKIEEQLCQA